MSPFFQFFYLTGFGAACWALGGSLLAFFLRGSPAIPPLTRHILSFSAGNIAFSYLLTALGFARLLIPSVLWGVSFAGMGLAIWRIAAEFRDRVALKEEKSKPIRCNGREEIPVFICLFALVGLFLSPAILQAAAPPYLRDSLVYHLLCPKEYLRVGGLFHIEGNLYSAFPKGHEVLMTLLLATAGDRAAQALAILQHVAAVGALFSLSRLMAGLWAAGICTLGYATVPPAIYFSGCGYVEPALLMTLGGSLLAMVFFCNRSLDGLISGKLTLRESAFIGFLAGWMPALKYTGMIYLGLVGILLLWSQRKEPAREALKAIGVFAVGAAPGLCWMGWNWLDLGNPVYPLAYSFFGGKGWDDVRDRVMSLYFDRFGMGREAWDYLLLPWRFSFLGRFDSVLFDGAMGPFLLIFLILAVASAIRSARRRVNPKMPAGMGFVLFASATFFILGSQQARFWLPFQFLACFYAAPIVELIHKWTRSRRPIKLTMGLVVVVSLAWNGWFLGRQVVAIGYYKPAFGLEEQSAFLKRVIPGYAVMEFINHHLPARSRLFCVWTGAYAYYLDRPYYSDTFLEDAAFRRFLDISNDGKDLSQRLARNGFTHLFVRRSLLEDTMTPRQLEIFGEFLEKGSHELYRYQDFSVFVISASNFSVFPDLGERRKGEFTFTISG
jgi:hypothetical protein